MKYMLLIYNRPDFLAHLTEQGEKAAVVGKITERTGEPVTFEGKLAL